MTDKSIAEEISLKNRGYEELESARVFITNIEQGPGSSGVIGFISIFGSGRPRGKYDVQFIPTNETKYKDLHEWAELTAERADKLEAESASWKERAETDKATILALPRKNFKAGFRSEYYVYLPDVIKVLNGSAAALSEKKEERTKLR